MLENRCDDIDELNRWMSSMPSDAIFRGQKNTFWIVGALEHVLSDGRLVERNALDLEWQGRWNGTGSDVGHLVCVRCELIWISTSLK